MTDQWTPAEIQRAIERIEEASRDYITEKSLRLTLLPIQASLTSLRRVGWVLFSAVVTATLAIPAAVLMASHH